MGFSSSSPLMIVLRYGPARHRTVQYNCLWWCDPENPAFYYGDGDEGDVGTSDDEGDEEESDDDVDEWNNTFDL